MLGWLVLLAASTAAHADISGTVTATADGDTLTVLSGRKVLRVRLAGIEAPENSQPFGDRSKKSLETHCLGKRAAITDHETDRFGQTVGRVSCGGVDMNAEQVRRGLAWVSPRAVKADSPLHALQAGAKAARLGLWSQPNPTPPWAWRRGIKRP